MLNGHRACAVAALAATATLAGLIQAQPSTANPTQPSQTQIAGAVKDPDKTLGKKWRSSPERAVTSAADSDGLHLLVADGKNAYAWKTAAALSEPGLPADTWIGNQCVIDHDHAAVVYAPRMFTNRQDLMTGGAFTAIVNLTTGQVTKMPLTASLAYFDPSCNPATHTAAFTAFRDSKTHLVTVDTSGKAVADTTVGGEVTSAVPTPDGVIAGAGTHLVRVDHAGHVTDLAETSKTPFDIQATGANMVAFLDRHGSSSAQVKVWDGHRAAGLASGKLGDLTLKQSGSGRVFLVGRHAQATRLSGSAVTAVDGNPDGDVSTDGSMVVDPVISPAVESGLANISGAGRGFTKSQDPPRAPRGKNFGHDLTITATATSSGTATSQSLKAPNKVDGGQVSPALAGTPSAVKPKTAAADSGNAHDPVDEDRWCSVPRNDIHEQALQPTPNQVEWAVDMAIRGDLHSSYLRQGDWRSQTGIATIDPQTMFPPPTLTGGGRIPAQIELGILAQESNLWQAESGSIPGQMGNPLAAVAGFYGHKGSNPSDYWKIDWTKSDCGYGVGQVTDGMRMAGHEKPGETALPANEQKAIALDYATNIAASLQILADKWNELHKAGQTIAVNNDDPSRPENWFTAVWNYNLGFNAPTPHGNDPWGLGWYNNPANPIYPPSRLAFMDTTLDPNANHDAAHPQDWPYEEKVMGWAAWSIDTGFSYSTSGRQDWPGESGFSSAGFRPSWWNSDAERSAIKPPLDTFCNASDACDVSNPPPCETQHIDGCDILHWWNQPNTAWKPDCATSCGHEAIKYTTLINEPGRGYRLQHGTPDCANAPTNALVVDSEPAGVDTWSSCGKTTSNGTFQFTFAQDSDGRFEGKGDLHQVGGGWQGHFWYAHARNANHLGGDGGPMLVLGDWKLNAPMPGGQGQIWAHIPDTGAQAHDAVYSIITPFGTYHKTIDQGFSEANAWVSLGAYRFNNSIPEVQLANDTPGGTGDLDIAWDAMAFVPGDFSGMPHVDFPAENPNLPDIDEVAAQTPDAAPAPVNADTANNIKAAMNATRGADKAEQAAAKCSAPDKSGQQICIGPFQGQPSGGAKPKVKPHAAAASSEPVPWCKTAPGSQYQYTRTQGCIRGGYALNVLKDGAVVGGGNVKVVQEILLNPTSNSFSVWTEFSLPDLTGVPEATLDSYLDTCWATADCTNTNVGAWSGSTTWTNGDAHTAARTDTFSWNTVTNGQSTLGFTWDTTWSAPGTSTTANNSWRDQAYNIRCDNQVGGNTGCVFPAVAPTLLLNTHKYPAAAAYYWVVEEMLASHPGSKKYNKPLHRLADDTTAKNNRKIVCDNTFNPPSAAIGKSCDEYPFAKSRESGGMTLASGNTCVQMYATKNPDGTYTLNLDPNYPYPTWQEVCGRAAITVTQNTAAGGDLGRFTTAMRLLDKDAYFVRTGFENCTLDKVCKIT